MSDPTSPFLDNAQSFAREQVDLVWQEQLERLHQMIAAWPGEIERTLLATKADLIAAVEDAARKAHAQISAEVVAKLNQSVRRLRSWEKQEGWAEALLDATQDFCEGAALFTLDRGMLHLESARNIRGEGQLAGVPVQSAPAFAAAVETRDTIVAMRIPGEMSEAIASYLGEAEAERFLLFPVVAPGKTSGGRIAALLYVTGRTAQVEALELLTAVAGAVLEGRSPIAVRNADLISIASVHHSPLENHWSRLSDEDREVHLKAQRFARVQIASLRLYKSSAVKKGRAESNLYTSLREELDAARAVFRQDFISKSTTMVDYLHLEVVQTLANNEVELLGSDYPGPLV